MHVTTNDLTEAVLVFVFVVAAYQTGSLIGYYRGKNEYFDKLHKEKTDHLALRSLMIGLQHMMGDATGQLYWSTTATEWREYINKALEADYSGKHHHIRPADEGSRGIGETGEV